MLLEETPFCILPFCFSERESWYRLLIYRISIVLVWEYYTSKYDMRVTVYYLNIQYIILPVIRVHRAATRCRRYTYTSSTHEYSYSYRRQKLKQRVRCAGCGVRGVRAECMLLYCRIAGPFLLHTIHTLIYGRAWEQYTWVV